MPTALPRSICSWCRRSLFSAVVWIADPLARPSGATLVGSYRPSDGRVDCAAIQRGHRLARRTAVPGAGSGPCLRERLHPAHSCNGHSGSPDLDPFALAEWICGELIGSIRRECLDHVVVFGERHLRNLRRSYQQYYNECRTHLSLDKDAQLAHAVTAHGRIAVSPVLGGLHHDTAVFSFRQGHFGRFCQITPTAAWVRPPPHIAPKQHARPPVRRVQPRRPRRSDAFEERAMFTL